MSLLRRLRLTFWLGLLAVLASGTAQHQLSFNVLDAALKNSAHEIAGHYMPDGTFMAGAMHGSALGSAQGSIHGDHTDASQDAGHTHKGHADCNMCGAVAAMAAVTLSAPLAVPPPSIIDDSPAPVLESALLARRTFAPYASRAPPSLNG